MYKILNLNEKMVDDVDADVAKVEKKKLTLDKYKLPYIYIFL